MQRRAIDAEEGEEVEEQRPGHDADRDPRRPPEQPAAAYDAADRRGRRGPLLGHGAAFFLPGSPLLVVEERRQESARSLPCDGVRLVVVGVSVGVRVLNCKIVEMVRMTNYHFCLCGPV
jgi:hypothetical protein